MLASSPVQYKQRLALDNDEKKKKTCENQSPSHYCSYSYNNNKKWSYLRPPAWFVNFVFGPQIHLSGWQMHDTPQWKKV